MHLSEWSIIAWKNIRIDKKTSFKMILGFSAVIMLLISLSIYQDIFVKQCQDIVLEHKNDCYLYESQIWEGSDYVEMKKKISEKQQQQPENKIWIYAPVEFLHSQYKGSENFNEELITFEKAELIINNKKFQALPFWKSNRQKQGKAYETEKISFALSDEYFNLFPEQVIAQYEQTYPNENYLIGTLPSCEGEIIISDYMLECFGIDKSNQPQLIGKEVSLYVGKEDFFVGLKEYRLCGIYDADILDIREEGNISQMEQMGIYPKADDWNIIRFRTNGEIRYYEKDFKALGKLYNQKKESGENIEVSPHGSLYLMMDQQLSVIHAVLLKVIIGFVFAVMIYITSMIYFFLKRNEKYTYMLRAIGMTNCSLHGILLFEILYILFISILLGTYLAFLILFLIKYIYEYAIHLTFSFSIISSIKAVLNSFAFCFILFLIEGCLYYRNGMKKSIANVLRNNDR